jgi:hypothetical protein
MLRTIIENNDVQMIISTHDRSIFDLAKIKLPSEHYPTIFMDVRNYMKNEIM